MNAFYCTGSMNLNLCELRLRHIYRNLFSCMVFKLNQVQVMEMVFVSCFLPHSGGLCPRSISRGIWKPKNPTGMKVVWRACPFLYNCHIGWMFEEVCHWSIILTHMHRKFQDNWQKWHYITDRHVITTFCFSFFLADCTSLPLQ